MATYESGSTSLLRSHNFVSSQELHKPHIQSKLVKKFNETLTGFLDLAGAKAPTDSIEYSRFEKKRIMPKIKATNSGAVYAPGATVTFTIHADSKTSFGSYDPYDTGVATTNLGAPVRKYDVIQMRPAAGTLASAGNYINAIVISVTSNTSFDARPLVSTDVVPPITSAQEIIIIGNAHGEGTGYQAAMSTKVEKFDETLQIMKHKYEVTGTEKLQALWVEDEGGRFMLPGESDGYLQFLNSQDTTFLVGQAISNTALAEDFVDGTLETNAPILTTNGVITQALSGGNTLNYSSITGVTLADLYDYNTVIDKQSAEKDNMVNLGIDLDQQLDRELGDRVVNGAISYGTFSFDQDKAIALNFSKVRLGSFTYNKRTINAMNDAQTLGADGFGYSHEGLMLPMGMSKVVGGSEEGAMVPTLRKRFLANKGKSREIEINFFDGLTQSDNGVDRCEVRYQGHAGVELQAKNKAGYWKRA